MRRREHRGAQKEGWHTASALRGERVVLDGCVVCQGITADRRQAVASVAAV